jgi:hypothetical protein
VEAAERKEAAFELAAGEFRRRREYGAQGAHATHPASPARSRQSAIERS